MAGKELIEEVCLELNIDYKGLAEKIGANSGTVRNWIYKNEVPLWADKSINLLLDNYRNGEALRHLKTALSIINKTTI